MNERKILSLDTVILWVFLIYMITFHIFSYRAETLIISKIVMLLLISLLILYFLAQRKFIIGWRFFFVLSWNLIVIVGYFWAPFPRDVFSRWMTVFQLTMLFLLLSHFLDTEKKIKQVILSMTISYVVLGIYMIYSYGISLLFSGSLSRIGNEISRINTLGMSLAFGAVFSFYYFYTHKKNLMILPVGFLTLMSSFTGSRKAIIVIFIGIFLLMLQDIKIDKTRFVRNLIIVVIFFAILLSLASFDLVFTRLESALSVISGKGSVDRSTYLRMEMISTGFEQFLKRPIIGTGFDSFKYFWAKVSGNLTYSHNNYIELMVSGGLLALFIYYGTYIYLLKNIWKRQGDIAVLLLTILLVTLSIDMFVVSYLSKDTYIFLAICFSYVYIGNNQDSTKLSDDSDKD